MLQAIPSIDSTILIFVINTTKISGCDVKYILLILNNLQWNAVKL